LFKIIEDNRNPYSICY